MKISKIFHWLYFTVMMLPCVIIPIFAIYTRNENYNSNIEVQIEKNEEIAFNQLLKEEKIFAYSGSNYAITKNEYTVSISFNNIASNYYPIVAQVNNDLVSGHYYYLKTDGYTNNGVLGLNYFLNNDTTQYYFTSWYNNKIIMPNNVNRVNLYCALTTNLSVFTQTFTLQFYDLTAMGLEDISISDFNALNIDTSEYITNDLRLVNIGTTTYNDTDVGSQFVYTLYNATDKYFNFDNFFGLDNVYSWMQLNWFSGNAPLGFAIFWHFFTYWLLASLAWLLFDLMVYVPLYIHRWLDKGAIE